MRSEIHFNRDQSIYETIRKLLGPTGNALLDGVRLATINGCVLITALIAAFGIALISQFVNSLLPTPDVPPGLVVLGISVVFGLVVWYRYATEHRNIAFANGETIHPDRFGIIAGSPFAALALLLLGSGLFGLLISFAGLNIGGIGAALGRITLAVLFGLLAAGSVFISRLAMRN